MSTDYHAKFYAFALTRRSASDSLDKLGQSLLNATVDLNPHQIDAALFAFRSPLSRGAILADEVGLGKTIEAGLIISQLWAERRRKTLAIVPTTLRKQWAQELADKFYLPWEIFDARAYNSKKKSGVLRPFEDAQGVVICSYHFALAQRQAIAEVEWDLVVIDEAHRLRNVYKSGNKIARAIKEAVLTRPKVLLTATPLQNSLFELFGLVGFLDEHLFGDMASFRSQYLRGPLTGRQFDDLKRRIRPICQRTLRRQVTEYVRYTNRIPITQDFTPTEEEQRLYDHVSAYLRRATLHALPSSQRKLMTLVLRKLLASSSFAIAGTLRSLLSRLDEKRANASTDTLPPEEDFEAFEGVAEEWSDFDAETGSSDNSESTEQIAEIDDEIRELTEFHGLATSITMNAKGEALLHALASVPLGCEPVPTGSYQLIAASGPRDGRHVYRPGHPLAEFLIARAAARQLEPVKLVFDYSDYRRTGKISLVEELVGKSGFLSLTRVSVQALEREDHLVFSGHLDAGEQLDGEVCEKLFNIDGRVSGPAEITPEVSRRLEEQMEQSRSALLTQVAERNGRFFEEEIEKLERWAEDLKDGLEQELKELDAQIKALKKQAKFQVELESKLALHRQAKELEGERSRKRRALFDAQDEIDRKKESLISEVEARLQQQVETESLFTIRWEVR